MRPRSRARSTLLAVAALGFATVGAACSSSGSTPSAGGAPSTGSTVTPGPGGGTAKPKHTHTPAATGPAGKITAPASIAPTTGAEGGSETFPHINASQEKHIVHHVLKMAGVLRATWYPQFKQIQVYFTTGATAAQRQAVISYVTSQ